MPSDARWSPFILACVFATGCGAERDAAALVPVWSVEAVPSTIIGTGDQTTGQLGFVVGATRLADGSVVVADRDARAVRRYLRSGAYAETLIREGPGPQELRSIASFIRHDSLLVIGESFTNRLLVFSLQGNALRSWRVPRVAQLGSATVAGLTADGGYVATAAPLQMRSAVPTFETVSVTVLTFASDTAAQPRILTTTPGRTFVSVPTPDGPSPLIRTITWFRPTVNVLVGSNQVFVAYGDSSRIRRWRVDGVELPEIDIPRQRANTHRDLTVASIERSLVSLGVSTKGNQLVSVILRDAQELKSWPQYRNVLISRDGLIWVEHFRTDVSESAHFSVLDANGALVALVHGVPAMRVLEIGPDFLLGATLSDSGEPLVVVHRVVHDTE